MGQGLEHNCLESVEEASQHLPCAGFWDVPGFYSKCRADRLTLNFVNSQAESWLYRQYSAPGPLWEEFESTEGLSVRKPPRFATSRMRSARRGTASTVARHKGVSGSLFSALAEALVLLACRLSPEIHAPYMAKQSPRGSESAALL